MVFVYFSTVKKYSQKILHMTNNQLKKKLKKHLLKRDGSVTANSLWEGLLTNVQTTRACWRVDITSPQGIRLGISAD